MTDKPTNPFTFPVPIAFQDGGVNVREKSDINAAVLVSGYGKQINKVAEIVATALDGSVGNTMQL